MIIIISDKYEMVTALQVERLILRNTQSLFTISRGTYHKVPTSNYHLFYNMPNAKFIARDLINKKGTIIMRLNFDEISLKMVTFSYRSTMQTPVYCNTIRIADEDSLIRITYHLYNGHRHHHYDHNSNPFFPNHCEYNH